jgi:hypothetical protein
VVEFRPSCRQGGSAAEEDMPARSRRRPKRCVARPKSRKSSPSLATRPAAGQRRAGRPSCHGRPWRAASPSRDGESCPLANGQTSTVSGRRNAAVGLLVCFSATTEKNRRSPIEADPVMPLDRNRHARFAAGSAGETFTQAHHGRPCTKVQPRDPARRLSPCGAILAQERCCHHLR